jgi:hypothetical protein
MMNQAFQPSCPARPHRDNVVTEPFGENAPTTMWDLTDEPPRDQPEVYLLCRHRADPRLAWRIDYELAAPLPRTTGIRPFRLLNGPSG